MDTSFTYKGEKLTLEKSSYESNNTTAITVKREDGQLYSVLSVNLPESFGDNVVYIDVNNNPTDLVEKLEKLGFIQNTGITAKSGFCEYPLYAVLF